MRLNLNSAGGLGCDRAPRQEMWIELRRTVRDFVVYLFHYLRVWIAKPRAVQKMDHGRLHLCRLQLGIFEKTFATLRACDLYSSLLRDYVHSCNTSFSASRDTPLQTHLWTSKHRVPACAFGFALKGYLGW